jgi:hypothetical protein
MRRYELLSYPSFIERFRSVTKKISILQQKGFRCPMWVIDCESRSRLDRYCSSQTMAAAQERITGEDAFWAAGDSIKLHLYVRLSQSETLHREPLRS